jgi:FkbM family methyltransferase
MVTLSSMLARTQGRSRWLLRDGWAMDACSASNRAPAKFRRLTENIERNCVRNITTFRVPVGSRPGDVNLHIAGDLHGGLNTIGAEFPYEGVRRLRTETVPATTLDEFIATNGISQVAAVKLDIEGAEGNALTGAERLLCDSRPALVVEVFSRSLEAQGWTRSSLGALLRKAGYVTFSIDDATGRLISADDLNAIDEQNVVACPREAAVSLADVVNA